MNERDGGKGKGLVPCPPRDFFSVFFFFLSLHMFSSPLPPPKKKKIKKEEKGEEKNCSYSYNRTSPRIHIFPALLSWPWGGGGGVVCVGGSVCFNCEIKNAVSSLPHPHLDTSSLPEKNRPHI